MKNRPGEKIKLASIDELLGVVNEECRTGKIGGTHVYFKTCWEDIITAGMADPFCDRLGSKNDSTDLYGCQRDSWVYIHFIDHSDCILLP